MAGSSNSHLTLSFIPSRLVYARASSHHRPLFVPPCAVPRVPFHSRTLLYGGVFFYPPSRKHPAGKLYLLFEASPIAFLMEQANGGCTTGFERLLSIEPTSVRARTPMAFGSFNDIDAYRSAHHTAADALLVLPLAQSPPSSLKAASLPAAAHGVPPGAPPPLGSWRSLVTPYVSMGDSAADPSPPASELSASSSSSMQSSPLSTSPPTTIMKRLSSGLMGLKVHLTAGSSACDDGVEDAADAAVGIS